MQLAQIIAELEGAAQQEAAGIHVLETTRFEPELGLVAGNCLAAARRRAEALSVAAKLLRGPPEECPDQNVRRRLLDCRSGARGALQAIDDLADDERSVLAVFFKKRLRTFGSLSFETLMCEAPLRLERANEVVRSLLAKGLIEPDREPAGAAARYWITLDGEQRHFRGAAA